LSSGVSSGLTSFLGRLDGSRRTIKPSGRRDVGGR
jgi:hypothetical protein